MLPRRPTSTPFPYTTLFRSVDDPLHGGAAHGTGLAVAAVNGHVGAERGHRSEEHTSELQSHHDLVCRLLLEKKNTQRWTKTTSCRPMTTVRNACQTSVYLTS